MPGAGAVSPARSTRSFSGRTTAAQPSPAASEPVSPATSGPLSSFTVPGAETVAGIRLETPMKPATKLVVGRS